MDTTFITIHDLSAECRILYASNSVVDILGFYPEEVINHSSWDFFHPDEIPFAQAIFGRGISLDKAAVLNYAKLRSKSGQWIGCECVFSIVNDVLVGCVSRYTGGLKSQKRAMDAPIIRQLFSSSPRDPRYHMLSYISNKFTQSSDPHAHEPRAALFLNRFTRTLPIMFASNGLQNVLGISSDQLHNKSFYYCIQENCLPEAIRCLESAKANDSIAYLRFWYRNPNEDGNLAQRHRRRLTSNASSIQDDEDGGVPLNGHTEADHSDSPAAVSSGYNSSGNEFNRSNMHQYSSDSSTTQGSRPSEVFDHPMEAVYSTSTSPFNEDYGPSGVPSRAIELEAVVSCTSDGLVVVLRQARPFALDAIRQRPMHYKNGIYASPWASEPILPDASPAVQDRVCKEYSTSGAPVFEPMYNGEAQAQSQTQPQPQLQPQMPGAQAINPHIDGFMQSIREVAVFAWALTGLNGCLEQYSRGAPASGAIPDKMPVWEPHASTFNSRDIVIG